MEYRHIPVMLKEVIEYLQPQAGDNFIDCTLGGAGYTIAIAQKILPKGKIISIDLDDLAIKNAKEKIKDSKFDNIILVQNNFKNLQKVVEENWFEGGAGFSGIVLDLGLSSAQLDDRARGFSFQFDTPLDMAFGQGEIKTIDIINQWGEKEIVMVLRDYGEEKFARLIAQRIVRSRKDKGIETTGQLINIIEEAVPAAYARGKIHFATRTFQALRIATNGEIENLEEVLPQALSLLRPGGRIGVISYHSLEDRIVKNFFRQEARECVCPPEIPVCQCEHEKRLKIITRKVLIPTEAEIKNNPRARSAKMRVAEKI